MTHYSLLATIIAVFVLRAIYSIAKFLTKTSDNNHAALRAFEP